MVAIYIVSAIAIICGIYLFLIAPSGRKKQTTEFFEKNGINYAHRGLHGNGVPENSLEAFRLAVNSGFGIELDVHAVKDGVPVVFHDATLNRMVGVDGRLADYTSEELEGMRLLGTEEKIPTFREVLELVDGKVPLIVELKQNAGESGVASAAAELLKDYKGDFVVESFDPVTVGKFKKLMPEVQRGILAMHFTKNKTHRSLKNYLAEMLVFNRIASPDFVAFCHSDSSFPSFKLARGIWDAYTVAWTVRSKQEEEAAIKNGFDSVIFENYIPE
jgi:glycerophosphoryl diester phosphodiesterase